MTHSKAPTPGAIGVMLDDTRTPARLFELLDWPTHMGLAYFEPVDDRGAVVAHRLAEFWPLIDHMPT